MRNILFFLALTGCLSAVAPVLDCTERVIEDAAKQMGVAAIVADVGQPCGLDAAAVIAIILAHSDKTQGTRAYLEAMRAHDSKIGP